MSANPLVSARDGHRRQDVALLLEAPLPLLDLLLRSPTDRLPGPFRQVNRDEDLMVVLRDRGRHHEVVVEREFVAEDKIEKLTKTVIKHYLVSRITIKY